MKNEQLDGSGTGCADTGEYTGLQENEKAYNEPRADAEAACRNTSGKGK